MDIAIFLISFIICSTYGSESFHASEKLVSMVSNYGYPIELHYVTTSDGYILQHHRIPGGRGEKMSKKSSKPVVLMTHSLLGSSPDWVVVGPNRSLAFLLAEDGYDIWLCNNRGNTYAKNHTVLSVHDTEFWDFSWHELGILDLTSTIDYILEKSGQKDLTLVCFSQGCTQFFVMGSIRPEYNKKIRFVAALSPAVFLGHLKGVAALINPFVMNTKKYFDKTGYFELLPSSPFIREMARIFCRDGIITQDICFYVVFSLAGPGTDDLSRGDWKNIFEFSPAGCSWKQIIHYLLGFAKPGTFAYYDYGLIKNLRLYNSSTPPAYPLEKVDTPIAFFHGLNDYLGSPEDVEILAKKLPNVVENNLISTKRLNHLDLIYGRSVRTLVFDRVMELINLYRDGAVKSTEKENLITAYGYPLEIHHVTTIDGYILELQRIPGGREDYKKKIPNEKPVVLMMHGILCSSADWVVLGPNRSLAFLLADKGYDVWMGNNRGNTFSKGHISRSSSSFGYWDFSWHEMGIYDLPATIDYILKNTKTKDLTYVCFSQGCTQFLVMGSLKPEYNKKIKFVTSLAPAAFTKYLKGLLINLRPLINFTIEIFNKNGYFEVLPASSLLRIVTSNFCKGEICWAVIFAFVGNGYDDIDRSRLLDILAYLPAGCSFKQLVHFWNSYENHGTFSQYDYGSLKNLQIYNSTTPPSYPLENVKVPIAVFHGINDYLVTQEDISTLVKRLPNVVEKHLVTSKKYNHLDFLYGRTVTELVYDRVLYLIEKYTTNIN